MALEGCFWSFGIKNMIGSFLFSSLTSELNSLFRNVAWSKIIMFMIIIFIHLNVNFLFVTNFFHKNKSKRTLVNECNITISFSYLGNNKLITNIIQSIQWFVLLKHIFLVLGRCIFSWQYIHFSSTLLITLYFYSIRKI